MTQLGIIAAGSPHTAAAGVEALEAGGNAVDAVVSAVLATPVSEPGLSSMGGGGAMQFFRAGDAAPSVCEFFANGPGLEAPAGSAKDFIATDLDFGPTTQRFYMGRASAAVPGFLPGLLSAWERWGSLPLAQIVAPVCRFARDGVPLDAYQAFACSFHGPMLMHSEGVRRIFAVGDQLVGEGDQIVNARLADTLEALSRSQWRAFYAGEIAPAIVREFGPQSGGLITEADLAHYEPRFCEPLQVRFCDVDVFSNPPPAAGGALVSLCLELLSNVDLGAWGSEPYLRALDAAMRVVEETRTKPDSPLEALDHWRARFAELLAGGDPRTPPASSGPGHTTHVSAVDAAGNAAATTVSYGQGAGYVIGETGIPMNNLMGEKDLHPRGFHTWPPGTRLSTNMSPTVLLESDGGVSVLGSGGSNRIRTAILQVIVNAVALGLDAEQAVGRSRIHTEGGTVNAEVYDRPDEEPRLRSLCHAGEELVAFPEPNMFFGGVHLARRLSDGTLTGAGDPRRSGVVATAVR